MRTVLQITGDENSTDYTIEYCGQNYTLSPRDIIGPAMAANNDLEGMNLIICKFVMFSGHQ